MSLDGQKKETIKGKLTYIPNTYFEAWLCVWLEALSVNYRN